MIPLLKSDKPKSGNIEVGSIGSLDSSIAFVGEAPAKTEILQGEPLVGKSGRLFNLILSEVSLRREDQYLTNLFKFEIRKVKRKVGNSDVEFYFKGSELLWRADTGFTEVGEVYRGQLLDELSHFKGNVICPMGNAALWAFTEHGQITKWRGSILWYGGLQKKIVPTIHPAAALRDWLDYHLIKHDFGRAKEESKTSDYKVPNPKLIVEPSFTEAKQYLIKCSAKKKVSFDIEVLRNEVSCIAFCFKNNEAMSIPFVYNHENCWTVEQEIELWNLIAQILKSEAITKIGQNLAYDITFIFSHFGIITQGQIEDTMIAHRILYPEYPMGLDFITSTYTKHPYYKDEGKQEFRDPQDWKTYWQYNARDALVCFETIDLIKADLRSIKNLDAYEKQARLIIPSVYMGRRGMRTDKERLDKLAEEAKIKMTELQTELEIMTGRDFNPNSHEQCKEYFYGEKKVKPYLERGKSTANEGALVRLKRRGFKEAGLILQYRNQSTFRSRYYTMKLKPYGTPHATPDGATVTEQPLNVTQNDTPLHDDFHYRLHYFFKPVTEMARFASTKDLDGYGGNAQNQPKSMNIAFLADPGNLIFNADLSQSDARSVAYIGNVRKMIEAFETGIDIHSLTASELFGIPADEVKQMDKEQIKCQIGYGDQTHRFWGKTCNHALNFDLGYKKFSYMLEITEKEGLALVQKYHEIYPDVRSGYQLQIKEQQLSRNRTVTNCFGRKFLFFDRWGDELFKKAYAFPAQSNTAEIINRWGLLEFYYNEEFKDVDLLRQVHDSINFQLKINLGAKRMANLLIRMKRSLERPLHWADREFVIPSEWSVGTKNLGEQTELRMENEDELTKQLKGIIK